MGKRLLACVMAVVLAFPPYAVPAVALTEDEPSDLVIEQVDSSDEQASVDLDVQESLTDSSEVVDSPTEDAVVEDEQNESPSEAQNEPGDTEEASGASPAELGTAEGEEEPEPTANVPDDATYWCGHYYKVYDAIGTTPAAARAACAEKGGYLVTYTSVAECRFLTDLLNSNTPYGSIDGGAHYIINSVADIGDNNRQWATGEVFKYEEGFLNVFLVVGEGRLSGFGESVVEHSVGHDNRNSWNYWGRMNYAELASTTLSNGKPALNVRGYVCEWGSTHMGLNPEDITLGVQKYTYSSSTSSYKPSVTVKYNVVNETLEKNNDYLLDYYRNSAPGVAKARITGQGRFSGVAEKSFYITPGNISNLAASAGDEGAVLLSWSGGDGNSGFEIQCSTDSSFPEDDEKTTSSIVNTTNAAVTPPQGSGPQYYVRVRAITNDSTDEGKKAWGSWTSTLTLPGPVELDYLEVGFGGNVTVHWKNDSATNALSGYQIQHRFAQTGEPMTTTVNGYSINLKKLTSLSYNDYEIRIRSYKGSGSSQLYSPWSEWAACPVKEIKIINPTTGYTHADPFCFKGLIDLGVDNAYVHDDEIPVLNGANAVVQHFPLSSRLGKGRLISEGNALFEAKDDTARRPDSLLECGKTYHVAIPEKAIEYMESDDQSYSVPVFFEGIKTTDQSTWKFSVESTSFSGVVNPEGLQISDDVYKSLFKPQHWKTIKTYNTGIGGHCFGLSYIVGAYKAGYTNIKKILSGYTNLTDASIYPDSELMKYAQMAHIYQSRPEYVKEGKNTSIASLYKDLKNGKKVLLNLRAQSGGGHTVYPICILDDTDTSNIKILVYDSNAPTPDDGTQRTFLNTITLANNMNVGGSVSWHLEYKTKLKTFGFMDYCALKNDIDSACGGTVTPYDDKYTLVTSTNKLEKGNFWKVPLFRGENTSDADDGLYDYWYEGTSYHYEGSDEPVSLTLANGTDKLYVNLAAGQSATLDIANNKVTIDSVSNGGKAGDYSVRFSHADDYETFHDTVISGTSGNSGTVLQKVTDQIEVQTDSGTNLTVSNEENGRSTGTSTVNLSQNQAVIRTDGGVASVFVDKDGDGNYTDREQPIVVPEPGNESPSNPGKTDGKPTSGTSGSGSQNQATTVVKGRTYVVGGQTYKVTKVAAGNNAGTVSFVKAKNAKSVTVPATVKLEDGKSYAVTQVGAKAFTAAKIRKVTVGANVKKLTSGAFTKSKATTLVLKTQKLKKAGVKGSLKGSKVTKVQVKVGAKKVNKKYVKSYKKIFTKKIAGKKVRVL